VATVLKQVPGFLPSTSGLHFSNSYPVGTPFPEVKLPVVGTVVSGDAGNGICGGFTFTVLDMFLANLRIQPPSDITKPDPETPQFKYLARRQVDAFESPKCVINAVKIVDWVQTPDDESLHESFGLAPHGLSYRVVREEWPRIKKDIDSNTPSPLMLVMEPQCVPMNVAEIVNALGHCHQVLAYAYSLDDESNLRLWIYDCNHPDNDLSTIDINILNFVQTINITAAGLQLPWKVRGFFRSKYKKADPKPFRSA
jgi:hypothetical protein